MPTTYFLRNTTTGGVTPPGANEFTANSTATWTLLTGTAASATFAVSTPTGTTERGYAVTLSGVPGAAGVAGTYTVELNVTTAFTPANNSYNLSVQVHRVNSTGVSQAASTTSATQLSHTTGIKTFTVDGSGLGTFGATDRLRVDYIFANTSTMTTGGPTITINTVDAEVVMPDPPPAVSPEVYYALDTNFYY